MQDPFEAKGTALRTSKVDEFKLVESENVEEFTMVHYEETPNA